ncbi:centromere/kinetochore protein zw10 homolog [Gadus macrocephalus]|uniref:centromere/kinetochore protein zw10 homolog n=1 Tax=Gadus macrocephalus TaxID=80720 RepID=UPI0028CB3885|nr:centromere/kinetochore protein zw10 homolog [Gadus macrocephalus]
MASFVTEVLASSGKLEKEDLAGKICKISRRVEDTKEAVCDMINKRYKEFLPSLQASEELMDQVEKVSREMDVLKDCIDNEVQQNIHCSLAEYAKVKQQLEKNTIILTMLGHLKEFHNAMEDFSKAFADNRYVDAAKLLEQAQLSVDSLKTWKSSELPLLRALGSELIVQRENFIYHLGAEWKRLAIWKLPSSKEPTNPRWSLKTELKLTLSCGKDGDPGCPAHLSSILQALAMQGDLHYKIKLFSQVLLKNMLRPLIVHRGLSVRVTENSDGPTLTVEHLDAELQPDHSSPSQVYTKLLLVLRTLHSHLLDMSVGEKKLSAILGEMIWEELSHCIIHECLVYSIPTKSSQLENYNAVIKETEEFESSLKEMQYLQSDSTDLLKYAKDVNCHFASKKCKDVIVAARKLMTSKMHNTVRIKPETRLTLPKLPAQGSEAPGRQQKMSSEEEVRLDGHQQLSSRTLCLPVCRISESVQQLMELAFNTQREAVGSSVQCALQLFFTVRNIFQLFYDVVPTYHKENLLKFPHLAAIQHNNCMYLAHHLLILGHSFRPHMPPPLSDGIATFVDMVPGFRKLGAQCFLAQLNTQKAELLERLSTARNFSNLEDEENYTAASKAVRQVIHQLKQLGIVWQDVLPVNIYCKAMGSLLNTAISEVMAKIMLLEDISSEDGEHLHTLCQTLIVEGPLVFVPLAEESKNSVYQEEVPLFVKRWMTFKELVIVLRANLQEIVNRWAEGKGPLAMEFSGPEMKSLVRALFQNTERRALALAKIK